MSTPVRAAVDIEPAATPEEIAAILAVLEPDRHAVAPEREPAWRIAARREAIGASS